MATSSSAHYSTRYHLLTKSILLLCLIQRSFSFGLAGSEIRANRVPISSCFSSSDTRRYNNSNNADRDSSGINNAAVGSAGSKESDEEIVDPAVDQNTKYVKGLIDTLESLMDKWIVSGSMPTRRKAYNVLQQIERLSLNKDLSLRAQRLVKRAGMPMDAPPPIPPTEHIPAVDQQQQQQQQEQKQQHQQATNVVHKPMGAMMSNDDEGQDGKERKENVDARLEWEQKHKEKSSDDDKSNEPRSALSARMADGKGGDPFLNGVVEGGTNGDGSGVDPFTFAEDKKDLQDTLADAMNGSNSASSSSSSDDNKSTNNFRPTVIATGKKPTSTIRNPKTPPSEKRAARAASAKSSELIAAAGSGPAFSGAVLGVGGLDDVLAQIQRRVWIPLAAPPTLLAELGIRPVRGLLLYGSPGCGKTLLARKLGSILSPCRPITIVSGPEILDKFVGSSEKNLREIFDNPPEIYHEYKKNYGEPLAKQALHVIVLDEFDAIARRRGGSGGKGDQGDAGVARDSVVNQLLAKMDGVDEMSVPTLLVGLTNKPQLIDAALMRPGRFEVQIEVPKPRTVEQRVSILKVHTESMVKNGRVLVKDAPEGTAASKRLQKTGNEGIPTYDELLDILAVECDGMSGASLAGVSRAAASRALERAVTDFAGHIANESPSMIDDMASTEGNSISDCLVTQDDFEKAVEDVFDSAKGGDYTETDMKATNGESEKKNEVDSVEADASVNATPPL